MGPPVQLQKDTRVAAQLIRSNAGENTNNDLQRDVAYCARKCISDNTRRNYRLQMEKFAKWLKQHYPEIDNNVGTRGELHVNISQIPPDALPRFLAFYRNEKAAKGNTLSNIVSGIKSYYADSNKELPKDVAKQVSMIISGVKILTQEDRREGKFDATEGKDPLTFVGYRYLGLCFYKKQMEKWGFYTILTWNLMCRTDNTQHIAFNRMQWHDDCLKVLFSIVKTDHSGDRGANYKHVYANPYMPEICPILSLGVYLLSTKGLYNKIFSGANPAHSYSQCLAKLKTEHGTGLNNRGVDLHKFGVHSLRKGAATYAMGGVTEGPSFSSVALRCDWSIGSVQGRYIRYEKAGDQYVGRIVSGLPLKSSKFAVLPPYFEKSKLIQHNITLLDSGNRCIPKLLFECFGNLLKEHPKMVQVAEMALASVVYHRQFLRKHLKPCHALYSSPLFTKGYINILQNYVVCTQHSEVLNATGIPPIVILQESIEKMQRRMIQKQDELLQSIQNIVGGAGSITSSSIVQADITHRIVEQVKTMLDERMPLQRPDSFVNRSQSISPEQEPIFEPQVHEHEPLSYFAVPLGWTFPRVPLETAWKLWWEGDRSNRIKPFRAFVPTRDLPVGNLRKRYCEWKSVFLEFERLLDENDMLNENPNPQDIYDMYEHGLQKLVDQYDIPNRKRNNELKVSTFARKIGQSKGKRRKLS